MESGAGWARERFGVRQCLGAFDLAIALGHQKSAKTLAHSKTLSRPTGIQQNLVGL